MIERRAALTRAELERRYAEGERDFRGANLSGADLSGANLSGALNGAIPSGRILTAPHVDLTNANLYGANLYGANLYGANLSGADLTGANLTLANLYFAILKSAILANADLSGADLTLAFLAGADFDSATCGGTVWVGVDLAPAAGLASIRHRRPSYVDIRTLIGSGGDIPDVFLRGCGVPDHIIELQKALVHGAAPIEFYSCFISYSQVDEAFAQRLHGRLQHEKLRVWYAPEEMKGGRKLHEQIDEAIRVHDKLLLVLSEASMASEWVATEISKARKQERKEGRQVLFPIGLVPFEAIHGWECFDADTGKDSAREIREYYIPDFSTWKNHDAFELEFAKLLRDLRKSAE